MRRCAKAFTAATPVRSPLPTKAVQRWVGQQKQCFVYLVSLCVYMLPSWYTRDHPTRKSPIWSRHAPVLCFQLHKHLKVQTPNPGKFSLQKLISHICSYFCRFQLKQDA
uniref:Uncharacterized protein n=1 Tax=Triticum urartu TaxID=4572 RepID=A0A8R7PD43_TRIUA